MARDTLVRQLSQVQDQILVLGSMVGQATLDAVTALKTKNMELAKAVYRRDQLVNEKRFSIENAIIIIMATQQPMARDLRLLSSQLEINTELERMGDYAKGIAKVTLKIGDSDIGFDLPELEQMATLGASMLHRSLTTFIDLDTAAALAIPREDDEVDRLFDIAYRKVLDAMIASPEKIDVLNYYVWALHNLERMADRVTNICERTVYITTGELFEVDSMDDEDLQESDY
ncbi:MAG TPA: phosphate signaling complex protein PhoU [Bellilinea sp.]|nr:phosphate signaling complex protein PhoU [Bellilinea sp.]